MIIRTNAEYIGTFVDDIEAPAYLRGHIEVALWAARKTGQQYTRWYVLLKQARLCCDSPAKMRRIIREMEKLNKDA